MWQEKTRTRKKKKKKERKETSMSHKRKIHDRKMMRHLEINRNKT